MRPPKTLGERIRYLRLKRGMHQNELARRLSVYKSAVSQWEMDQTRPRTKHAESVAKILKATKGCLLF
ncbi:helix-turn-helix domain-containing protein [Elusimicrobiota bacterium]